MFANCELIYTLQRFNMSPDRQARPEAWSASRNMIALRSAGEGLTPPEFAFWIAEWKIKRGHYRHDVDEQRCDGADSSMKSPS
jgi:hypothetical protein